MIWFGIFALCAIPVIVLLLSIAWYMPGPKS